MRRVGIAWPERPGITARADELAEHGVRFVALQRERVGERGVAEPGDVAEPVRVGEVDLERPGDVEAVGPVLGQAGRGEGGRAQGGGRPAEAHRRICGPQRFDRRAPSGLPPREHRGGSGVIRSYLGVDQLVDRHRAVPPRAVVGRGAGAGHHCLVGLGEVDDDIADGPTGRTGW